MKKQREDKAKQRKKAGSHIDTVLIYSRSFSFSKNKYCDKRVVRGKFTVRLDGVSVRTSVWVKDNGVS